MGYTTCKSVKGRRKIVLVSPKKKSKNVEKVTEKSQDLLPSTSTSAPTEATCHIIEIPSTEVPDASEEPLEPMPIMCNKLLKTDKDVKYYTGVPDSQYFLRPRYGQPSLSHKLL